MAVIKQELVKEYEKSHPVISDEQIAQWKSQYGKVHCIEYDGGATCCYLRTPERSTVDAFMRNSKDTMKALETIVKNCWLGGDESFKTDVPKLISIGELIEDIIGIKKSSLKTL